MKAFAAMFLVLFMLSLILPGEFDLWWQVVAYVVAIVVVNQLFTTRAKPSLRQNTSDCSIRKR